MGSTTIHGETRGLKTAQRTRLERLYRRKVQPAHVISPQLATTVAQLSAELGRQIGLLLNRRGFVVHVVLGTATGLMLPDLGRHRAGPGRFRGLRLVHTHLDGELLSQEDLTDLQRLRLDLVSALLVGPDGRPTEQHSAHLLPENPQGQLVQRLPPHPVHEAPFSFVDFIAELEAEFLRKADLRRGAEDGEVAIAVHVSVPSGVDPEGSLRELRELSRTAGVVIVEEVLQKRSAFDPRTLMGRGKLQEIVQSALQLDADLLLVDHDLAPHQLRAISEATDLKVIDRTTLILDIFAQHAQTREGKLQVELAQLRYALPRMAGRYGAIMRQAGGVGARRGPGEKQLELDRRHIQRRIRRLEQDLQRVSRHRSNQRARRRRRGVPVVALVGYTNAGKSTLLNTLTSSEVLVADKLFATLDPTSRRLRFPQEREVIFSDTVGFIRDLPRDLLRAFKATLEELQEADLLLHVVDGSDPERGEHAQAVRRILADLGLDGLPRLTLVNKADRIDLSEDGLADLEDRDAIPVCALDPESTGPLLRQVERRLWEQDRIAAGALTS